MDYVGESYYTIRNLSLYECQGWCREEPECVAASFSFAVNNVGEPKQETVCLLQNGTQANNPSAKPTRALNQYYMVKLSIRSGKEQSQLFVAFDVVILALFAHLPRVMGSYPSNSLVRMIFYQKIVGRSLRVSAIILFGWLIS